MPVISDVRANVPYHPSLNHSKSNKPLRSYYPEPLLPLNPKLPCSISPPTPYSSSQNQYLPQLPTTSWDLFLLFSSPFLISTFNIRFLIGEGEGEISTNVIREDMGGVPVEQWVEWKSGRATKTKEWESGEGEERPCAEMGDWINLSLDPEGMKVGYLVHNKIISQGGGLV
jgi:hypothetical protein